MNVLGNLVRDGARGGAGAGQKGIICVLQTQYSSIFFSFCFFFFFFFFVSFFCLI